MPFCERVCEIQESRGLAKLVPLLFPILYSFLFRILFYSVFLFQVFYSTPYSIPYSILFNILFFSIFYSILLFSERKLPTTETVLVGTNIAMLWSWNSVNVTWSFILKPQYYRKEGHLCSPDSRSRVSAGLLVTSFFRVLQETHITLCNSYKGEMDSNGSAWWE